MAPPQKDASTPQSALVPPASGHSRLPWGWDMSQKIAIFAFFCNMITLKMVLCCNSRCCRKKQEVIGNR
jgi:hypothetical protein